MNLIDSNFTPYTAQLVEDVSSRFLSAYSRDDAWADYERMNAAVTSAGRSSAYNHRKLDLVKKLTAAGLDCSMATSPEELKRLIGKMPTQEELESQLYQELYDLYSQFPTASDFMARLVRRLADPDLLCESIRLTIVRQFLRHTNYNVRAVKDMVLGFCLADDPDADVSGLSNDQLILRSDERIFEVLNKPMSRDDRRKYALIRLADDLAGGKFRMGGKTKTDLYMFAFAFGMSAGTGAPGEEIDPQRDVEKNLFRDFYNDNLLRYISEDFQNNITAYEQEPSGEGINYKNFAEVIYLYYLNRPGMTSKQKLTKANACIDNCVAAVKKQGLTTAVDPAAGEYTEYYRGQFLQQVCALSPDELTDFICRNYVFPDDIDKIANIAAETQRRTAARIYDELLAKVLTFTPEEELEEMSYGLDLNLAMSEHDEDSPFAMLMTKLDEMLRIRFVHYPVSGTEDAARLSRTSLISLCAYYYYITGQGKGLSLPKLLKNFRMMADPLLEQSRFQRISEKNVFDMFTIIALYHLGHFSAPLE